MAEKAALDPVAELRRQLPHRMGAPGSQGASARDGTALRACVLQWWQDQALAEHPPLVAKRIALALLEQPDTKLAGVVVLHELLADHLRASDLASFEPLFASGALADATVVDSFGIKVIGTMLLRVRGRAEVARALASWRSAETLWQRRAACVAFTVLAPQGDAALQGLAQLIFTLCNTVVWSHERGDQTAVGWLLRELSRAEPTRVEAFIRRHARLMSRECVRQAAERLPNQRDLLAHWRRATTLRR